MKKWIWRTVLFIFLLFLIFLVYIFKIGIIHTFQKHFSETMSLDYHQDNPEMIITNNKHTD